MLKQKLSLAMLITACVLQASCSDENESTLAALSMPGDLHVVSRCVSNNTVISATESECTAMGGIYDRMVYVANMGTGTLSFLPFYPSSAEFKAIDITTSVPGVTSIPVGERPMSVTGDTLGAFVVLTSSINNDISIISVNDNREIAYQELDKVPRKIEYDKNSNVYYVFFTDGTVRSLSLTFNCGMGENILPISCKLSKEMVKLNWKNVTKLSGTPVDYVADPIRPTGYVSFADRRYISVLGLNESAGACLDGSTSYPCEIKHIGAGYDCADGIDNDGNGLMDEDDPSCFYPWSMEGSDVSMPANGWYGIGECTDNIDNSGNGLVDMLDPGCVALNDASEEPGFQPMTAGTCGDGVDNDGDGDLDRDDLKCRWPSGNEDESNELKSVTAGLCRDGIDNNGDGKIDGEDLACYGKNGFSETSMVSNGRGNIDIDPIGRWLYVLDPVDSQLIVIDLEKQRAIDRSGWYPRNRIFGIPVSRLALDVSADIRQEQIYSKNGHEVYSDRAVAYVSSSSGLVTEVLIHNKMRHYKDSELRETVEELALRPTDTNDEVSYIGTVRCVGRICDEKDLPLINLRERPAISYFASAGVLSDKDPETGLLNTVVYDAIMASETWRITYEGALEKDTRSDGHFSDEKTFKSDIDMCALGARPGDHLVILKNESINQTLSFCEAFQNDAKLEWEITDAGPNYLSIKPTGVEGDVQTLPDPRCFANGLEYEIRASNSWIVTSKSTFVNRRFTAGTHCIDDPRSPFGQTRFTLDSSKIEGEHDAQTAFFSIDMPMGAEKLARDDAFEFTTRSGLSTLSVGAGSAPTALKRFTTEDQHFLLISDASANSVIVYDVDEEAIDDTI